MADQTVLDIEVIQGSTFEWLMLINDVDDVPLDMASFTGGTAGARGKIRKYYTSVTSTEDFTITVLNKTGVLAAIAAGTCHITVAEIAALKLDAVGSCYLLVRLTAVETAAVTKGNYVYDIEVEDLTGFVFKPYMGACEVLPEATR